MFPIEQMYLLGCPREHQDTFRCVNVELGSMASSDQVTNLATAGKFCSAINRPLFNHLGIVTTQLFDAFHSNAVPLLCFRTE